MSQDIQQLAKLFRDLGASDPEGWAGSQIEEGISQLHRYLFLRQAWSKVIPDGDRNWIEVELTHAENRPRDPFAGTGMALRKLIDEGADCRLLSEVVRGMQAQLLFNLCYLLEYPMLEEGAVSHIGWRLVESGGHFEPTDNPIVGLHEFVLETDPSGREMRPRDDM